MNYGSTFSGIGGLDAGLHRAGHVVKFLCESDHWRRSILAARFPGVPIFDDVRDVGSRSIGGASDRESVDLLIGGFPCQDLSIAGKRAGFRGNRSSLFFEFARIASELVRPGGFILLENVTGLFSSHAGRDFATLLRTLDDIGFEDLAWRVLDSRWFGVPQRRRRVFILARRARGVRCAEILLEPESRDGNPPTRRQTREETAGTLGGDADQRGWSPDTDRMTFVPDVSPALKARDGKGPLSDGYGDGAPLVAGPLGGGAYGTGRATEDNPNLVGGVRRLTPTECLRLQGLPDNWFDGVPSADSRKYAALGDAVTANVAHWIGVRLSRA